MAQVTKAQLIARVTELEAQLAQERAQHKFDNKQADTLIDALRAELKDTQDLLKKRVAQPQEPAQPSPSVITGSFRELNTKAKALVAQGKRVMIRGNQLTVLA